MALIMSRQHLPNGAPPLPSRGSAQVGRSQSETQPVIHVRMGRQTSEPARPVHQTPAQQAPPPVNRRQQEGNAIQRRNFETNSFVDRNTARAFSNPASYQGGARRPVDNVIYPVDDSPAPPPVSSIPRRVSAAGDRPRQREEPRPVQHASQQAATQGRLQPGFDAPVRPPRDIGNDLPGRPPRTGAVSSQTDTAPERPPKHTHVQSPERPTRAVYSPAEDYPPQRPERPTQSLSVTSPPPGRPPKVFRAPSTEQAPNNNPCMPDLEKRFCFHSPSEFPAPESMSNCMKTRASMTKSFKRLDQQERIGHL